MLAFQLNIPEIFSEALTSPAYMVATPMVSVGYENSWNVLSYMYVLIQATAYLES